MPFPPPAPFPFLFSKFVLEKVFRGDDTDGEVGERSQCADSNDIDSDSTVEITVLVDSAVPRPRLLSSKCFSIYGRGIIRR